MFPKLGRGLKFLRTFFSFFFLFFFHFFLNILFQCIKKNYSTYVVYYIYRITVTIEHTLQLLQKMTQIQQKLFPALQTRFMILIFAKKK